jgi:hypothetical protein
MPIPFFSSSNSNSHFSEVVKKSQQKDKTNQLNYLPINDIAIDIPVKSNANELKKSVHTYLTFLLFHHFLIFHMCDISLIFINMCVIFKIII